MAENTKIEWTDHTFNPWEGCQKIGPGCDHCYAEARNARFAGGQAINWGPGAPRRRTSAKNWYTPFYWNDNARAFMAEHGRRQRVFCASLADVFDNEVDPQWRADLFDLIAATPHLDWLLLTKRIGNVKKMLPSNTSNKDADGFSRLWPHVWIGATICNQEEADRDIPKLLAVPAAKRFLSMEPLLGPVDLTQLLYHPCPRAHLAGMDPDTGTFECCKACDYTGIGDELGIDWVIVGGESGPGARPMHPDWARSLRDQCQAAGVPFLFKQWGEWCPRGPESMGYPSAEGVPRIRMTDAGHNGQDLAADGGNDVWMNRAGKKAAGRLLDGRTWDEVPA